MANGKQIEGTEPKQTKGSEPSLEHATEPVLKGDSCVLDSKNTRRLQRVHRAPRCRPKAAGHGVVCQGMLITELEYAYSTI